MKKLVSLSVLCIFMACLPCKANIAVVKGIYDALVGIGIGLGLEQIADFTSEWFHNQFATTITEEGEGTTQNGDILSVQVTVPRQATIDADSGDYDYSCSAASRLAVRDAQDGSYADAVACSAALYWSVDGCTGWGSPFSVSGTTSSEKHVQNRCTAIYSGGQATAAPSTHLTYDEYSPIDIGGGVDQWFPYAPPFV